MRWLLARGEADYAIIQGDVAAAAVAGEDVFARGGPLASLRAVGGLFPEAVHIVVLANSPIRDVGELRGHRVGIGAPASGTRFDALAVLEAHGLKVTDLAEARGDATADALARLKRGQLHAVFLTTLAPTRALQEFAVSPGLRLIPVGQGAMQRLRELRPGLTPVTLPANTYPRQHEPVVTVASAALLVTTADAPDAEVAAVADLVFKGMRATVRRQRRCDPRVAAERTPRRDDSTPSRGGASSVVVRRWRVAPHDLRYGLPDRLVAVFRVVVGVHFLGAETAPHEPARAWRPRDRWRACRSRISLTRTSVAVGPHPQPRP